MAWWYVATMELAYDAMVADFPGILASVERL
jgi:hypothetical protein